MGIPRDEQESTFLIDETDNQFVHCYSCQYTWVRKLTKIAEKLGIEVTIPYEGAIRVKLPVKCLLMRVPKKKKAMSEEQREASRLRFQKMWEERRAAGEDLGELPEITDEDLDDESDE